MGLPYGEEIMAGKARLPTVESLTEGTDRRLVPAERSARRPGRSATGSADRRVDTINAAENSCRYTEEHI